MAVLAVWGNDTSGQEDQALGFGGEFCPGPGGLTGRLGPDSIWVQLEPGEEARSSQSERVKMGKGTAQT